MDIYHLFYLVSNNDAHDSIYIENPINYGI